tara:strand:+ start:3334 stop:3597 length:264 start_codon:yes stop_codon:yes gene_type:complete
MDSNDQQRHVQDEFFDAFDELWGPIIHEMHPVTLPEEIAVLEKKRIETALELNEGNRTRTADQLGIGRTNLIAKLRKYDLLDYAEAS